jgi:hypothetical protein
VRLRTSQGSTWEKSRILTNVGTVGCDVRGCTALPACNADRLTVPRDEGRWLLQPDWGRIGFSIDAEDYYQYQVVPGVFGINRGFIVKAIGDLDGDGVLSTFQRAAYLSAGEIQGRQIEIINALE